MRHAGKRAQPGADRIGVDPARQAYGRRGHRILEVVCAAQAHLAECEQRTLLPPQLPGPRPTGRRPGRHRSSTRRAQPPRSSSPELQRRDGNVVVALAGEHEQLRPRVGLEGPVPIEVIGR